MKGYNLGVGNRRIGSLGNASGTNELNNLQERRNEGNALVKNAWRVSANRSGPGQWGVREFFKLGV